MKRCQEAVAIARTVGARPEEGHALNTLGYDLTCLGEAELGVQSLREALTIAEEVGDLDDLARAPPQPVRAARRSAEPTWRGPRGRRSTVSSSWGV